MTDILERMDNMFIRFAAESNEDAARRRVQTAKDAAEEIKKLREALAECNFWVNAAIECKNWMWDGDQKEAAIFARDQARAALGEKK